MSDYLKATEGLNVVKTIYMEVDLDSTQQKEEADFVIETCKRGDTPMVAGVISGGRTRKALPDTLRPSRAIAISKACGRFCTRRRRRGSAWNPSSSKASIS